MDDWLTEFIEQGGYGAIALLMMVENIFPPIPSELIMPLAGIEASDGRLELPLVILAGTAGSVAGAYAWYWVGRLLHKERLKAWAARHGRWLTLHPQDIDRADAWFDRFGRWAVLFGRLVPVIRTLISVPAGASGMRQPVFLLCTAIGSATWTGLTASGGYALGEAFGEIETYIGYASSAVIALLVAIYLYRVVTFKASTEYSA